MNSENLQLLLILNAAQLIGRNILIDYTLLSLIFHVCCSLKATQYGFTLNIFCTIGNWRGSYMKIPFCTCRFSKSSLFQCSLSKIITSWVFLKIEIVSHLPCKKVWKLERDEKGNAFISSLNSIQSLLFWTTYSSSIFTAGCSIKLLILA